MRDALSTSVVALGFGAPSVNCSISRTGPIAFSGEPAKLERNPDVLHGAYPARG